MSKQSETLGSEHLLPYERGAGESEGDSTDKLFSILESDPVLGKDKPGEDESARDDDAGGDADDDGRESDETDDADEGADGAGDAADDDADEDAGDGEDEDSDGEDLDQLYERLRAAGYKRRIKVAGEETEVALDELDNGYSRTADYTRKTTETKQEREAYQRARDLYAQGLEQLQKTLEATKPKTRTADEWNALREEDATQFAAEWADHQRYQEAERELAAERAKVESEQKADAAKRFGEYADDQARRLHEAVPEFADPKKGPESKRKLVDYLTGTSYSFTDEELRGVVDHRLYVLAEKARKYDELTSKGAKDKIRDQQDRSGRPTLKPGGRQRSGAKPGADKRRAQLRSRLKDTGGRHDVAEDLMYDLLGAEEETSRRR